MVPCMQCNTVYICFIPKLLSLSHSLSMAEWAGDCGLQEVESWNVVLPMIICKTKKKKFLKIVQNTPTDTL